MNAVVTHKYIIRGAVSASQVNEKPIKLKTRYTSTAIPMETINFFILFCCFEINKIHPHHRDTGVMMFTLR